MEPKEMTIVKLTRDIKRRLRQHGCVVGPTIRGSSRPIIANYDRRCGREPSDWFEVFAPDWESPEWQRFMKRFKGSDEQVYREASRQEGLSLPRIGVVYVSETLHVRYDDSELFDDGLKDALATIMAEIR